MIFNDLLRSSPSSLVSMSTEDPSTVSTEDQTAHIFVNSNASTSKSSDDEPKNNLFNMDKIGNKHFRDEESKSDKKNYCRSYSEKFIQVISQLECAHCENPQKFDKDNLPMIARCGHYISEKCYVDHIMWNKTFICLVCREGKSDIQHVSIAGENEPIRDEVLSDFFNAIEEDGFRCSDCQNLHDPTNIVQFPGWNDSMYLCVWCASENDRRDVEKFKASHKLDLELTKTSSETGRLRSLNRTKLVSGWALDACCTCRKKLRDKKDTEIIVLFCGHISHKECKLMNFRPTSNCYRITDDELTWKVQCLFCAGEGEPDKSSRMVPMRKWRGGYYLEGYTEEEYKECGECKQEHPESNFPTYGGNLTKRQKLIDKCVWCTVEAFGPKKKYS